MPTTFNRRQVLAALAGTPVFAHAAAYPSRPVKLVVGSPPGGPSDFLARTYADNLGPLLGQSFLVDNKPGASGTLAAEGAAKAAPDGHTLLVSGPASVSVAPHLFPKLGYDPERDFIPINMLGAGAFVIVSHPSLPVKTMAELIAYAKANPGRITYGSGGNGSSGHLATELLSTVAGIKMLHVPYKGDGQAVNDLLAGQIQLMVTAPNVPAANVKAGKLRLLAVTTRERVASMPDTPTVHESGLRDFEYLGWIVTFAPAGTPKAVIEQLSAAWNKVRNTPTVRQRLEDLAMVAPDRLVSGEPLATFLRAESARLGKVIRDAGIKYE
ncbi:Bug family tripartite tricarboxylate transporter substrate binding protein [Ramlibacter albus]|uniref:Tripartite tricarboxylate transporter substrate binding protein n=1 Tax=Ramlibacter albus TaxID=2079448 RepID=A0A923MC48_9BURK|nr:tripartite tricarboxylate transporter substrate binding protein [Ramlibacter albus]MBC5766337.1 tripartite tricarboxylate transporter substrate binding protein [Ramlibacter albus]